MVHPNSPHAVWSRCAWHDCVSFLTRTKLFNFHSPNKLLQNVIDEVLERDAVEDFSKTRAQTKGINISKLFKAINSLEISFSIWNKNADGSESQMKEFTSLLGSQKKKLLNRLCSKLSEVIYPDTCETVKQIWTDFEGLYNQISDFNLSKTAPNVIFVQAKAWVELFCSLKRMRPEYTRPRVTPYIHTLVPYIHTPLLC